MFLLNVVLAGCRHGCKQWCRLPRIIFGDEEGDSSRVTRIDIYGFAEGLERQHSRRNSTTVGSCLVHGCVVVPSFRWRARPIPTRKPTQKRRKCNFSLVFGLALITIAHFGPDSCISCVTKRVGCPCWFKKTRFASLSHVIPPVFIHGSNEAYLLVMMLACMQWDKSTI